MSKRPLGLIPARWTRGWKMLRARIFLNLLPFVVILFAVGIYAIVLFSRLATHMDIRGYYESLTALQRMDVALAKMHSGMFVALKKDYELGRSMFAESLPKFGESFEEQRANIGSEEELALFNRFYLECQAYYKASTNLLARPDIDYYNEHYYPSMARATELLVRLRELNHRGIVETNRGAEKIAWEVVWLMVAGMVVALLVASYACYHLGRSILDPIQSLTQATQGLASGERVRPVTVDSEDELGVLARSFNQMAEQLQAYRESTTDELMRMHRTMEVTLASIPDPLFVLDHAGTVLLRNPSAESLEEAVQGQGLLPATLVDLVKRVQGSGQSYVPHEYQQAVSLVVEGKEKWFLPRILSLPDKHRRPLGVVVLLYDITRFRLLDDLKTNLAATVSHEIKTPLTSIQMVLHLLGEKDLGPLNGRQEELLETAREEAGRLLAILNDLLDLTRLESGSTQMTKELMPPRRLLETVEHECLESLAARRLRLVVKDAEGLPLVPVDVGRIRLVFSNLIGNAVKFSPEGGTIVLAAELAAENRIRFSVTDQGPGVAEEYQHQIFERFFRVPGQQVSGAGLGLSISREIVMAHDGRIGVVQAEVGGSEFYFILPCGKESGAG